MRVRAALSLWLAAGAAEAHAAALAVRVPPASPAAAITAILPSAPERIELLRPAPAVSAGRTAHAAAAAPHAIDAWRVLEYPDGRARDAALAALVAAGFVAEPVRVIPLCTTGAAIVPANILQVRAPEAVDVVAADSTIIVAVIDSGSDLEHPDLLARLWRNDDPPGNASPLDDAVDQNGDGIVSDWEREDDDDNGYVDDRHGFDFTDAPGADAVGDALGRDADPTDEHGHGTHVAGILCADGALRGVAPFVQLMTVRAAYTTPFGGGALETDDAAAAIVYAVDNGARVLNLSWGDTVESRLIREAVEYAIARGAVVVAAAGNGGSDVPHWPSGQPGVVAVSAVDRSGARAKFSNFGPGVTLAAPGEIHSGFDGGILSLAPGGRMARLRGTSMAVPHVAGAAAILLSRPERPDGEQVRAWLVAGARRAAAGDWNDAIAHGVLDCLASVQSTTDVVVEVHGPPRAFRAGRVTLVGTILGADLVRWRVDARARAGGDSRVLRDWTPYRADAETLVSVPFAPAPDGDWEWTLAVETGDTRRHERHGRFRADFTPPRADSAGVVAAYRGAEPRWLFSAASNEEFALTIALAPGDTVRAAEAGFALRTQIETPVRSGVAPAWTAVLEDPAGGRTLVPLAAAPVLAPWPQNASLAVIDSTALFAPEPVAALAPGGGTVVWGRGRADGNGTLQAWSITGGRWTMEYDSGFTARPVAAADVNGDGAADVLGVVSGAGGAQALWLVTRAAGGWPDGPGLVVSAERTLGLFQLDTDAAFEALLSTRDSVFVYDDLGNGGARLQALVHPSTTGFRVFGADAAVGDLYGDGRLAIAVGDAEGDVVVWVRGGDGLFALTDVIDTGGTYAYDLEALPGGGFAVARQRSEDVAGDGFPLAVHEFIPYRPQAGTFVRGPAFAVLSPANALGAGLAVAPAAAGGWWVMVRGRDLYLARDGTAGLEAHALRADGGADTPLVTDLDGDGGLDLAWRSGGVARWARLPEPARGPAGLQSESLGEGRARLTWSPAEFGGGLSRVRRDAGAGFVTLGETVAGEWIDSTLAAASVVSYEIEALDGGSVRARSNRITVRSQALPQLTGLVRLGRASLRVRCTNALGESALQSDAWRVETGGEASAPRVLQVALAEGARAADLVLDGPLPCGRLRVVAHAVRDDQNGRLAAGAAAFESEIECALPAFLVRAVAARSAAIDVAFSRAVDAATVAPAFFKVEWNGALLPLQSAVLTDSVTVRLALAEELVGRGIPYRIEVSPAVRARDGTMLAPDRLQHWLRVDGHGVAALFAYPNPARTSDDAIVFAEASAATRVRIYDLEGQLVADLTGATGGGLRWNLRDRGGARVASGAYIYVASDGIDTRRGSLVVAR